MLTSKRHIHCVNFFFKNVSFVNDSKIKRLFFRRTRCRFDTSNVKMSTYLVAFVLSDFTSTKQKENTKIQLWSRDATKDQRAFSLEYAKKSVDYFEKLLDQKYQIEKMDLVAVPDFSAGAMENWGLLTFRESNLLVDKDHTSAAQEQRVGTVVVHEVAHQWFGNLVTPEKWNYLWLSEGFARYFEYMATDQVCFSLLTTVCV